MAVSSIAAEVVFSAGWIAVGAAAVYSRYKKALELGENLRAAREYHNGLFFGRDRIEVEIAEVEIAEVEIAKDTPRAVVTGSAVSLASLAQALEDAQAKLQPRGEKIPAP